MSRASSMRVATDSRIERAEEFEICPARGPRERKSAASGASKRGAMVISCPGRWAAKPSIQLTDRISCATCQKQVSTPRMKTARISPFNQGLAMKIEKIGP